MVICLERGADLHMAQLMPLPFTVCCFSKIQIGFTCLVPLTWVVPEKGPLNGCVCVCVYVSLDRVPNILKRAIFHDKCSSVIFKYFTVLPVINVLRCNYYLSQQSNCCLRLPAVSQQLLWDARQQRSSTSDYCQIACLQK